ncbi:MAG: energy transducer TonB [Sandaracinaceae bacterium]|nr:energy transducer TonB [Sandaracinaceae bacterium]
MLEGFQVDTGTAQKGVGTSLAASLLVYGLIAAGIVALSAIARNVVRHEELTQVTFRPLPEAVVQEIAPPPPSAAPPPVRRRTLAQPMEVPDHVSEAPVAPAIISDVASDGVDPGMGSATAPAPVVVAAAPPPPAPVARGPIQLPENARPPEPLASNASPAYPESARASGVSATVIAKIVVLENGSVGAIEIMRGHPAFDDEVRRVLRTWRFQPAMVEGRPTAVYRIIRIPFRLDNM